MRLKRFDDAALFYRQVEPFLLAREAEHNLLLGISTLLMQSNIYQQPYLACVEGRDGAVAAVALRTPPHYLTLSVVVEDMTLPLIVRDVCDVYGAALPGVSGPKAISRLFADLWIGISRQECQLEFEQRIYKLETVQPAQGVRGEIRPPTEAERDLISNWLMAFSAEAVRPVSREEAERNAQSFYETDPSIRGLRLWWDQGRPVSMAGYSGPTPNGIRIISVYTPPELRQRGYASACVAALSQEMLDRGRRFCFLFTDLKNPTSNHIYQTIGYEPVSDVDVYQFGDKPLME